MAITSGSMGFVQSQSGTPLSSVTKTTTSKALAFINGVKNLDGVAVTVGIPMVSIAITPYQLPKIVNGKTVESEAVTAMKKKVHEMKYTEENQEIIINNTEKLQNVLTEFVTRIMDTPELQGKTCGKITFWDPDTGVEIISLDLNIRNNGTMLNNKLIPKI